MTSILTHIKSLLSFYIEINYNEYLKENNISKIDDDKIESIINQLYYDRKDHAINFIKTSLKDLLKDEYPGDLQINNIFNQSDDKLNIIRIITEIKLNQNKNSN